MRTEEQFKGFVAVFVLFKLNGKVLLLRRANTGFCDGMYTLPAGHVEAGESPRQAAVREVAEEIGIQLDPADLFFRHTMYRKAQGRGPHDVYTDYYFEAQYWSGQPTNKEPSKCDDLRWSSVADAKDAKGETMPIVAHALKLIEFGVSYSEFGFD